MLHLGDALEQRFPVETFMLPLPPGSRVTFTTAAVFPGF